MTRKNNYDQSSTGTNIEATCYYDTHISRHNFEENFKIMQHDGYRTNTKAYYIDNGNVEDHTAITFTLKGSEHEIEEALIKDGYTRDEIKAMIPEEPFEILETAYGDKITLLNYEDFNKVFAPLSAEPSKTIEKIITRGYLQSDYAEIFYCPEDLEKAWGNAPKDDDLQKMFDHYFWDAPIYACITINDDEFRYDEQPDYDEYEWDREKFLKFVSEKSGVPIDTLSPLLVKDPSWL